MSAPIVLVPGFWLGAWAWDEVAGLLRADGHEVTALTLPGLEPGADPTTVHLADHVDAIVHAIHAAGRPVVLAVHSGSGFPGYAATDRAADRIAAAVYVDTGPGISPMDADFDAPVRPMPSPEQLAEEENLDGLSQAQLDTFQRRAVPEPGGVIRDKVQLTNPARADVPTTIVATGFPSGEYKAYAREHKPSFLAGLNELHDVTWIDLPTSHWPMWSKPRELAAIISDVAAQTATKQ
jgi:pimeloyl-ACP methyl ester carboxylesterase